MHLEPVAIRDAAAALAPTLVRHRRTLHRHPEPGFEEHRTARYVESELDRLGVPHRRIVGTGVVAVLEGDGAGCVGVRADMDGLPVPEAPGRDGYRSEVEGMSHACGHDAHVAIGLGLAELLAAMPRRPGTTCLYFQPAEEGPGGAEPMVAAGVLDDPTPDAIVALHVSSWHETGKVSVRPGTATGSDDTFEITIEGVGGHAAHPDTAVDPIPIAATVVHAVQQIMYREVDPVVPSVFTFGTICGGTRHNVIATSVRLTGTLRTVQEEVRRHVVRRVEEVVEGTAAAHGAIGKVLHHRGYPAGFNHLGLSDVISAAAQNLYGPDAVRLERYPSLGGEDFYSFGATGIPVAMFRLGTRHPEGLVGTAPHHSPEFDLDEAALPVGVATFAETLRRVWERYRRD